MMMARWKRKKSKMIKGLDNLTMQQEKSKVQIEGPETID